MKLLPRNTRLIKNNKTPPKKAKNCEIIECAIKCLNYFTTFLGHSITKDYDSVVKSPSPELISPWREYFFHINYSQQEITARENS